MSNREQIIQAASDLFENQGYHGTGINEIVKVSGAPKGSLYYYFPEGKEEIAVEAVQYAGSQSAERVREHLAGADTLPDTLLAFIETIACHVESSGFRAGGPLTIIASETANSSPAINLACREAYAALQSAFSAALINNGVEKTRAAQLGIVIVAAIEGGIILSRTYHSGDLLRVVAGQLACLLRDCLTGTE